MEKQNDERSSELMTRSEAARFLRLAPGTISNWQSTQKQKIPCLKLGGRIFYRQADLCKWVEQQAVNKIN